MLLRKLALAAAMLASPMMLAACETAEGYRQELSMWQGRTGDDLIIDWGEPETRSTLSDGRLVWTYARQQNVTSGGYYRDETRQVTRRVTGSDGKERTETITETFPVWQPPVTTRINCTTRFVLTRDQRIEEANFDGEACVAPERQS
jgi:hypothetical protein